MCRVILGCKTVLTGSGTGYGHKFLTASLLDPHAVSSGVGATGVKECVGSVVCGCKTVLTAIGTGYGS